MQEDFLEIEPIHLKELKQDEKLENVYLYRKYDQISFFEQKQRVPGTIFSDIGSVLTFKLQWCFAFVRKSNRGITDRGGRQTAQTAQTEEPSPCLHPCLHFVICFRNLKILTGILQKCLHLYLDRLHYLQYYLYQVPVAYKQNNYCNQNLPVRIWNRSLFRS